MNWDALNQPRKWKRCGHPRRKVYRLKNGVGICLECKRARARDYYYRRKSGI